MHLWKAGDKIKVDNYLDEKWLQHNALFHQLLQSLIELAAVGSDERSTLESISNHVAPKGRSSLEEQLTIYLETDTGEVI
jgi:hypothetical protein